MQYRIGEFAKLGGVSVKTLRFYDAVGLLPPSSVDPLTRYRGYRAEQLQDLATIIALKDLGASLREIRFALCRGEPAKKRRQLLETLHSKARLSVRAAEQNLQWLDAALAETSGFKPPIPVVVKQSAAVRVASIRAKVKSYEGVLSLERELANSLPAESVGGLQGVLWHRCADSGILEGEPFIELRRVQFRPTIYESRELPAITAACAYSKSNDDDAEEAYEAIRKWMHTRGFRLAGPKREIYLGPLLEIQFPLRSD
jgi:DNA-binding transcriptional MerR regulator